MAAQKNRQLFEVLAEQRARGKAIFGKRPEDIASGNLPADPSALPIARPRTGREIIVGLDGAFVIFVAVIAFVATAYYLGFSHGEKSQPQEGVRNHQPNTLATDLNRIENQRAGTVHTVPLLNPKKYTLLLRSSGNGRKSGLQSLLNDRAYLRKYEGLAKQVFIFHNYKEGVFWVTVGEFDHATAPELKRLKARLKDDPGPMTSGKTKPYKACSVIQIGKLGERWW